MCRGNPHTFLVFWGFCAASFFCGSIRSRPSPSRPTITMLPPRRPWLRAHQRGRQIEKLPEEALSVTFRSSMCCTVLSSTHPPKRKGRLNLSAKVARPVFNSNKGRRFTFSTKVDRPPFLVAIQFYSFSLQPAWAFVKPPLRYVNYLFPPIFLVEKGILGVLKTISRLLRQLLSEDAGQVVITSPS